MIKVPGCSAVTSAVVVIVAEPAVEPQPASPNPGVGAAVTVPSALLELAGRLMVTEKLGALIDVITVS